MTDGQSTAIVAPALRRYGKSGDVIFADFFRSDSFAGFRHAETLVDAIQRCSDELTPRKNFPSCNNSSSNCD
jgi:hypothetical protein